MNRKKIKKAFTLIELLTVIAIIALLTSIFGVGMRKVKIIQRNLQQKAVFHGMEVGLELFAKDFDGYPDSAKIDEGGKVILGAQRLAEALFGRDERGFHPRSKWHPTRDLAAAPSPDDIYTDNTEKYRKGPYTTLKNGGIYTVSELWGSPATNIYQQPIGSTTATERASVITDVFAYNPDSNGEKVGSPLLYFKADTSKRFRVNAANAPVPIPPAGEPRWVFDYEDNKELLELNWLRDNLEDVPTAGLQKHYQDPVSNEKAFYETITERQEDMDKNGTDDFFKAFNSSTFIIISAGYDGIYDTKDGITNFNY